MSKVNARLKGQLSRCSVELLGRLPLSVGRRLGSLVGWLNYVLKTQLTRTTRSNIERCCPALSPAQRDWLVRQSLLETGRTGAEIPQVWLKPYAWLEQRIIQIKNRELLDQALASEKGLVLLVPHLGNWEVLNPYLARITPLTALYQPPRLAEMERLMRQSREREGARLVPTNTKGVMALLKALKGGGTTAILPDQVPSEEAGEFAPFFGIPALTMTLVHGLIKRTGCQVLMGYVVRVKGGFDLVFAEPEAEIYSDEVQLSLAAMNRSVEACVNACPSQYQWEYKRFRKQPPGLPKFYGQG